MNMDWQVESPGCFHSMVTVSASISKWEDETGWNMLVGGDRIGTRKTWREARRAVEKEAKKRYKREV